MDSLAAPTLEQTFVVRPPPEKKVEANEDDKAIRVALEKTYGSALLHASNEKYNRPERL